MKTKNRNFIEYFESRIVVKPYTYKSTLLQLIRFNDLTNNGSTLTFKDITEVWGEQFKEFLKNSKFKTSTAKNYFSNLKAVLNMAMREKLIKSNPLLYVKMPVGEFETNYLTEEEVSSLCKLKVKGRRRRILRAFLFCLETGVRQSDIIRLKPENVSNGYITLKQKKTGKLIKNKLSQKAQAILKRGIPRLPIGKDGQPFSQSISYHIKHLFKLAGINKNAKFHLSRHSFGTRLGEGGVPLHIIMDLMGHTNLEMTKRYVKPTQQAKDLAIEMLDS